MQSHFTAVSAFVLTLMMSVGASSSFAQGGELGPLKVGIATTTINPEGPVPLGGYGGRKDLSTGAYKDLTASCIVIDNGRTRVAIVAVDILKIPVPYFEAIRDAGEKLGIPRQHLLLNHSHTHCGPSPFHKDCAAYMQMMQEKACGVLAAAVADLQEARLEYCEGTCSMGINRRQLNDEGKYVGMRPEPRKAIDPAVPVLRAVSPDGKVRAIVFGYACHPTTMGGLETGPDYPGPAREWVAAAYPGCLPIFLQGCGGDIKPRSCTAGGRFGYVLLDPKQTVDQIGYELGRAVVAALAVPPRPLGMYLGGLSATAGLPTTKQVEDTPQGGLFPVEVQVLRIGDLYIVGLNGEILVEIGLHIKRELPDLAVWVNGYSNRDLSYVANAAAYDEGGYEVTAGWTTSETEGILVNKAVELTKALQSAQ